MGDEKVLTDAELEEIERDAATIPAMGYLAGELSSGEWALSISRTAGAVPHLIAEVGRSRAALVALTEWAEAVKEVEAASAAMENSTANTYPELWQREHDAFGIEADKRAALLKAALALSPGAHGRRGGE